MDDDRFQYPPELFAQLVDAIPLLCRAKKDMFLFFRGAGMTESMSFEVREAFDADKNSLNKYEIARRLLTKLNELGDAALRVRRELLRRVVEYEDFTRCWPSDILAAKGLVAEIQRTVNVKDSFTRMSQAQTESADALKAERSRELQAASDAARRRRERIAQAKSDLYALFPETDPHRRGKALEGVLNRLFAAYEIPVTEDFRRLSEDGLVLEQIDGVIELGSDTYLVEMKWWAANIGPGDIAQHINRVMLRPPGVAGIFITSSNYTAATLDVCRDFLQHRLLILCTLREIVSLLEREGDLLTFLKAKIKLAKVSKTPFKEILD